VAEPPPPTPCSGDVEKIPSTLPELAGSPSQQRTQWRALNETQRTPKLLPPPGEDVAVHARFSPQGCTTLPSVALLLVLAAATATDVPRPIPRGTRPDVCRVAIVIDKVFRQVGPLLPMVIFVVQWRLLPYNLLVGDPNLIGRRCVDGFLGWQGRAFLLWLSMALLRVVLFMPLSFVNYYFSDHIFLVTCVIAQIETKLFLAYLAFVSDDVKLALRGVVMLLFGWALVVALLLESWVTAMYYHTVMATWTAFVAGTILFGRLTWWWTDVLQRKVDCGREQYKPLGDGTRGL